MNKIKATRDSWRQVLPMPEESKIRLQFSRDISLEEYDQLSLGFIPREMEDKWFVYLEDNWLYFHRSWMGYCIYQLRLECIGHSYNVAEVWFDLQPLKWHKNKDEATATYLLTRLIDGLCQGDR